MASQPIADSQEQQERTGLPSAERLLALTDAVIAIALTLLVLQLVVPASEEVSDPASPRALVQAVFNHGWGQFASYMISFFVIGGFWLTHHRVFRGIEGHSSGLAWANFVFLFAISMMPFTSELLGKYPDNPLSVTAFAANMLAASLATLGLRYFAVHHGLLGPRGLSRSGAEDLARTLASCAVVLLSIPVAWLVDTRAAVVVWGLLVVAPRVAAAQVH